MSNQAIWLIALLALSTAFGLYRKSTEGRIKLATPPVTKPAAPGQTTSPNDSAGPNAARSARLHSSISELKFGQPLGSEVTLVQFSSAFCQPCRATRLLLEDVASSANGVTHIEIDAEAHLDLVRELGVTRTPTTFILNGQGEIVGKSVGLPKRLEVMNVVQAVTANA
jgi:thiol-disulfide isomerase/thioredoxin